MLRPVAIPTHTTFSVAKRKFVSLFSGCPASCLGSGLLARSPSVVELCCRQRFQHFLPRDCMVYFPSTPLNTRARTHSFFSLSLSLSLSLSFFLFSPSLPPPPLSLSLSLSLSSLSLSPKSTGRVVFFVGCPSVLTEQRHHS